MKNKLNIIVAFIGLLFIGSCDFLRDLERGNGNIISENRDISAFSSVSIGGNFLVLLEEGEKSNLKVITDSNLHSFITTKMKGDELIITQEKKLISAKKIELIITYESIKQIRIMGAAKVYNEGTIEADDFFVKMEGAGVVDLELKTEYLEIILSGAGIIKTSGETQSQKIRLNGAGTLEAFNLLSKECDVVVSGLGSAEVFVTDKLEAKIEGVGGIEYAGNPENVITDISGLGTISEETEY